MDVDQLVQIISDESHPVKQRVAALHALSRIGSPDQVTPILASTLASGNSYVRSKGVKMLGRLSGDIALFRKALQDEDGRVRANAIESLWNAPSPVVKKILLPYLRDPFYRARANAARVFYDMADARGLETLMHMLTFNEAGQQASGAWMLGEVRETRAIDRLEELLEAGPEAVVRSAELALQKMETIVAPIRDALISMRHRIKSDRRSGLPADRQYLAMAASLQKIEVSKALNMVDVIRDVSPHTAEKMLHHLKRQNDQDLALAFLVASAFSRDDYVRSKSAQLIGEVCKSESVIRYFLRDADARVRANAIETLAAQSEPFVDRLLAEALNSGNHRIVANIAKGLCERNQKKGFEILAENIHHPDPHLRASCVWALGELGDKAIAPTLQKLTEVLNIIENRPESS